MGNTAHSFDFDALTVSERIQLAEDLWDSITASGDGLPMSAAQCDEIDRRVDAHALDPQPATSWAEACARIEEQLRGRL